MAIDFLSKCEDYPDLGYYDLGSYPFSYSDYTGRVYDMKDSYEVPYKGSYGYKTAVGSSCHRCGHEQCHEHPIQQCPDTAIHHEPWCVNNNDVVGLAKNYGISLDYSGHASDNHVLNHVGDAVSEANKKIYEKMKSEHSYLMDDSYEVARYKKKHQFAEKILPEAIQTGVKNAIECSNPYKDM